ncbi:MAG: aminopeptidase [Bacteroidetes bacterium]|nr:aminopeptidase [Bacteroidota bacterium]MCA6443623.1 aminopeptidase [Bacteroidota bacterium]
MIKKIAILFIIGSYITKAQDTKFNFSLSSPTQTITNKAGSNIKFTPVKLIDATGIQNQNQTGTCWSFSGLSFFESEMIRLGKGREYNLSEMFVARKAYPLKAANYIRMHGRTNLGEGGGFPDVVNVIKKYGMVPEEVYTGKKDANAPHNHALLETTIKNILLPAANDATQKIDFNFLTNSVDAVCDEYLGKIPEKFTYKGKEYTPQTYAEATGIKANDYVYLTSFTHHPYYSQFVLEVPDNWNWEPMYNLPLNEFQEVMSSSMNNGYTWAWAADVSEKQFMFADGIAIVTSKPHEQLNEDEKKQLSTEPQKQMVITPEIRQKAFDNYETQDDHGMHAVGMVKDQNGTLYYVIKNSWGTERNTCGGYFFASENYVLYKTTSIMIHKKAIPAAIAKKLGIQQ